MQARNIAIVFLSALLLTACLYDANKQESADKLVKELHQEMMKPNWDGAMKLYGEEFFKRTPREAWQRKLAAMEAELGPLQEAHKSFSQKDPRYSGDFYIYGYRLHFAKGRAEETVTIMRPLDKEKLFIVGHTFKQGK
jgi:outer membrane protein assembly factor BamD (BamD/ComL family)